VECDGLLKAARASVAARRAGMRMALALADQVEEGRHIEVVVALQVELDRGPASEQEGRVSRTVADGIAESKQGLAQIVARGLLRELGPEQAEQRLALVGPVGLDHEVGQQRSHLV